jgi:hypothetical protein
MGTAFGRDMFRVPTGIKDCFLIEWKEGLSTLKIDAPGKVSNYAIGSTFDCQKLYKKNPQCPLCLRVHVSQNQQRGCVISGQSDDGI